MKQPKKNLKNRLVKNVAVLSLAGILLCGQGLTAAAERQTVLLQT